MSARFTIKTTARMNIMVFEGELTAAAARDVAGELAGDIPGDGPRKILLNLRKVTRIDSAGLGLIVSLFKTAAADGGALAVCGARRAVMTAIEAAELDRLIKIFKSEKEARESF